MVSISTFQTQTFLIAGARSAAQMMAGCKNMHWQGEPLRVCSAKGQTGPGRAKDCPIFQGGKRRFQGGGRLLRRPRPSLALLWPVLVGVRVLLPPPPGPGFSATRQGRAAAPLLPGQPERAAAASAAAPPRPPRSSAARPTRESPRSGWRGPVAPTDPHQRPLPPNGPDMLTGASDSMKAHSFERMNRLVSLVGILSCCDFQGNKTFSFITISLQCFVSNFDFDF